MLNKDIQTDFPEFYSGFNQLTQLSFIIVSTNHLERNAAELTGFDCAQIWVCSDCETASGIVSSSQFISRIRLFCRQKKIQITSANFSLIALNMKRVFEYDMCFKNFTYTAKLLVFDSKEFSAFKRFNLMPSYSSSAWNFNTQKEPILLWTFLKRTIYLNL